jgi:acyl-CoA hydrolase
MYPGDAPVHATFPDTISKGPFAREENAMSADAKPVSATRLVMAQEMTPQDANPAGNVHGGNIMKLADSAAGVVSIRHSGRHCVTAVVDRFMFHAPVFVGNLVLVFASLNYVGRTSMEVGVRVEAEDPRSGKRIHTNSSYFVMVALDDEGRPVEVPPLILETDEDRRRNEEGRQRAGDRRLRKKT